jgi:hypothetical protein
MTSSRRTEFLERGFIVERGFFSAAEMDALCAELRSAQPRRDGDDRLTLGRMVFRTNLYFRSTALQAFVSQPRIVDFLTPIVGPDFWLRWDQAVNKLPGGGEFPWHQDNAYNRLLRPHYQLWVAVTAIQRDNGGLWLDPGSHLRGRLPHREIGTQVVYQGTPENPELIDAQAGDVILFSSLLLHYTAPNHSQRERWAYVAEYVPLEDFDPYIAPPYFRVARGGRTDPGFVRFFRGRLRMRNQLTYLLPRIAVAWSAARRRLRQERDAGDTADSPPGIHDTKTGR